MLMEKQCTSTGTCTCDSSCTCTVLRYEYLYLAGTIQIFIGNEREAGVPGVWSSYTLQHVFGLRATEFYQAAVMAENIKER